MSGWAHSSGYKHGDKVHTATPQRKWGRNFTVFFGVPAGRKQNVWRIVAEDGSELRLAERAWASMLMPGWVDDRGVPRDPTLAPSSDADLMTQINAQKAVIATAEARIKELNKIIVARSAAREAVRQAEIAAVDAAAAVIFKRNAAREEEQRSIPEAFKALF